MVRGAQSLADRLRADAEPGGRLRLGEPGVHEVDHLPTRPAATAHQGGDEGEHRLCLVDRPIDAGPGRDEPRGVRPGPADGPSGGQVGGAAGGSREVRQGRLDRADADADVPVPQTQQHEHGVDDRARIGAEPLDLVAGGAFEAEPESVGQRLQRGEGRRHPVRPAAARALVGGHHGPAAGPLLTHDHIQAHELDQIK